MKMKLALIALAASFATPAWAGSPLEDLADAADLSKRQVQMVIGNRTAFAEYRYTYSYARKHLVAAIGTVNFERLMDGERVVVTGLEGRRLALQLRQGKLYYAN